MQIVELKGVIAGPINLALGFWAGAALPGISALMTSAMVGFLGYGISLALFVVALRHLGTSRTGAYFSTAPVFGAIVAVITLGESLNFQLIAAGALMAIGVWLHITEHHEHPHVHRRTAHVHAHVHDEHHQHQHWPDDPPREPHTHFHEHAEIEHTHAHTPDMHHDHRH